MKFREIFIIEGDWDQQLHVVISNFGCYLIVSTALLRVEIIVKLFKLSPPSNFIKLMYNKED